MKMTSDAFTRAAALCLAAAFLPLSCAAPPTPAPPPPTVPPPPVDVSNCPDCHAGSKAYPLAADVYRYWTTSGHGQYEGQRKYASTCASCHDLSAAPGHLDGKKNAPGPNTFHLVSGYIHENPSNEWDFQVRFDGYCWTACHQKVGAPDMRHERDGTPARGAVEMGTHATYEKIMGDYPMDGDLAVFEGSERAPHYLPCVSCHDPHGTGATSTTGGSNRMARENYKKPAQLCGRCHY